jgi:imidazolonepropionase-like amidohydrolase
MEIFVEQIGMTPLEAIGCGTKNASFAVDPANVGTLEAGKWADILVVEGNPLHDIRILQRKAAIRAVFQGGERVDLTPAKQAQKWAWERGMAISGHELPYEAVYPPAADA